MSWLPHPPDLFPIEFLWGEFDRRVRRKYPKCENELFKYLKNVWNGLPSTFRQKTVGKNAKKL